MQSYDPTTQVPLHFSRVEDETFQQVHMMDRNRVKDYFGDLFYQNHFHDEPCLSHAQLSMWLGGLSMYCTLSTSYRYWSEQDKNDDMDYWAHLVWRIMHVLPLGYAFATHQFKQADKLSWHPGLKPIGKGVKANASNRHLAGSTTALTAFMKIFPEYFADDAQAMAAYAICDIFSGSPNPDNPLYVSIRGAVRKSLHVYAYPIPYFWKAALNQILSISPNDVYRLNGHTQFQRVDEYDLNTILRDSEQGHSIESVPQVAPTQTYQPEANTMSDSANSELSQPSLTVEQHNNDVHSEAIEEQRSEQASVVELHASKPTPVQPTPAEQASEATKASSDKPEIIDPDTLNFIHSMGEFFVKGYEEKTLIYNNSGAVIHQVDGDLFFVIPLAFDVFLSHSAMPFTSDTLSQWLVTNNVARPVKAVLTSPVTQKKFNIKLAKINPDFAHLFRSTRAELLDNDVITIG